MKKWLLTFLIVIWVVIVHATTYYISAAGSTGNTGTSITSTWPLSKVTGTFAAGDVIKFKKGDSFTGTINFTSSGSSGNPITFDVYGTALNNPVIDGGGSSSPVLTITGSYVTVNNLSFQNTTSTNGDIYISSSNHDINIYNVYLTNALRGIYFYSCGSGGVANLTVKNSYSTNIGINGTHANGSGSTVQMNNCSGSGIEVAYNNFFTDMTLSEAVRNGVGDVINFYQCNGTSGSYILAHDNNVRGGSSNAGGYAGLILGDVGGSYQNGYNNKFVKSGAEGCQIQGGTFITLNNNQMYSPIYTNYTFEGIGYANYSGQPCNNIAITNNKISWINKGGSAIAWYQDNSGNSTSTGVAGGAALTANFTGTTSQYSSDGTMTNSLLPDPLWTGSPWNTATTPLSFGTLATVYVGTADYSPGAVSSSDQGITYTSDNTAVATIVSNKIHVVSAGSANITANDQYNTITQPLTVLTSGSVIKLVGRKIHAN